jgi:hypothetical protein
MGNCKIRFQDGHVRDCDYLRQNLERLKAEFRKNNHTDVILKRGGKDRVYDRYCDELHHMLHKCCSAAKCDIPLKCPICPESDHEGHGNYFCRCESRNITLAKQLREKKLDYYSCQEQAKQTDNKGQVNE